MTRPPTPIWSCSSAWQPGSNGIFRTCATRLLRIQNKTYGICTVTGQLIDKNRLRLVPHATKSIDGKNIANAGKDSSSDSDTPDQFGTPTEEGSRPATKPIGDKVRLPAGKRPGANKEDWELDNETMEDAGYTPRQKFDDDDE
jgi:hypothetical protein